MCISGSSGETCTKKEDDEDSEDGHEMESNVSFNSKTSQPSCLE